MFLRKSFLAVFLTAGLIAGACGKFASPQQAGGGGLDLNPNPNPNPDVPAFQYNVVLNLFPLGTFPNTITIDGDFAYIVNSGSDNVQRINLASNQSTSIFAALPAGSNPWELAISGNTGFTSNFVSNNVHVIDMTSGALLSTISANALGGFNDPEGLAIAQNGLIFVGNADFDAQFNQGPGFVTVIDSVTRQVVNQIPTTQKNPQSVHVLGNTVYVVNSGAGVFDFVGCGCFLPATDGGVDIIDATQALTANAPQANIPIPLNSSFPLRGFPGNLAFAQNGAIGYLGSNSGNIFKVDLTNRLLLRGTNNPIVVTANAQDNLINMRIDSAGNAWVLSFNEDRVYLLDLGTDTVDPNFIDVGADPNALEGPLDLAIRTAGFYPDVYILMSVSEELSAIITN